MENRGPVLSRRLSGLDAAFLYLERKEIPLNVAGVFIFDRALPFERFVADIESKLDLLPRYRQVVVAPPANIAYPTWEDARDFDIRQHIFRTHLKAPGGEAELEALAGTLLSNVMDRSKPLWDMHVIDGLKNGRGALICRFHHALTDGVAGAEIVKVMFDPSPSKGGSARRKSGAGAAVSRSPASLGSSVAHAVYNSFDKLIGAEAGILDVLQALPTGRMLSGLQGVAKLLPELVMAVERLPFNKRCTGERKFCWAEFDFADIQAIRAHTPSTVNDVVLSVLARALARYVEMHGETTNNRLVRVICPVNLRQDKGESFGNQISFMPVVLPLDIPEPIRMLEAVAARMEIMKRARAADMLAIFANCLGVAPPPLQALFWRALPEVSLPLPLFNIICTNIPGSREPLYAAGRRLLALYPQVPTGYELGVGCAVHSYAGKISFGLVSDATVAPDVTRLRDFIRISFAELCEAAGVPERNETPRRRAAAKVARKTTRRRRPSAGRAAEAEPANPAEVPVAEAIAAAPLRKLRTRRTARAAAQAESEPVAEPAAAQPAAAPIEAHELAAGAKAGS